MHVEDTQAGLPDVGLYVDDDRSIAAVSHPAPANPSLHVASLHRTVLYVHGDGSASLGGTTDPNAVEFTDYVADEPASGFEPGDLVAMTFRCLLAEVAHSIGVDPSALAAAATFPSSWTAEQVSFVRIAMNRLGLDHVALVPETEALATWAQSTQATWAGSDSGIAAARGAASLAAEYPVDAVTESFAVTRRAAPVWTRTPVLAAAAFAALLAVGASVTALALQDSSTPTIPVIEGAPLASPSTTAASPSTNLPFPTVVPIVEAVPSNDDAVTIDPTTETPSTEPTSTEPTSSESSTTESTATVPSTTEDTDTESESDDAPPADDTTEGSEEESGEDAPADGSTDTGETDEDDDSTQPEINEPVTNG